MNNVNNLNNINGINQIFKEIYQDYNWDLIFGIFRFIDNKLYYREKSLKRVLILEIE